MPMQLLELKIPPPFVTLITGVAMFFLARELPLVALPSSWTFGVGFLLALMGGLIDLGGLLAFRRHKTTVNPMAPQRTTSIVRTGVYRYTRNPMYLGMVFLLVAWAVFMSSAWSLLAVPVFMGYMTRFQIKPEERVLAERFGQVYADYCGSVRRWL